MVAIGIKLSIVAIKNQQPVDLETLWDAQADLSVSYVVILNCFVYCQLNVYYTKRLLIPVYQ